MIHRTRHYFNDLLLLLTFGVSQVLQLLQMLARHRMYCGAIMLWHTVSAEVKTKCMIATHQSILHKFNGFIPYPLTQLPNYSRQWFVAEVRDP